MSRNKSMAVFAALVLVVGALMAPAVAKKPEGTGGGHGNSANAGGMGKGKLLKTKMKFKLDAKHWDTGAEVTGAVLLGVKAKGKGKFAPLAGATLTVYVDGVAFATLVTDAEGKAFPNWGPATDGKHKMKVLFAGDDTHKRSKKQQPFHVGADDTDEEDEEEDELEESPEPTASPTDL